VSDSSPLSTTPPPGLTWLHLLPSDAKLIFENAPDWLSEQARQYSCPSGTSIRVYYGDCGQPEAGGLISINGRASDESLKRAGLTYIRRFAAIPNLRNTRWLVPLDSAAISSAAFSLYTPTRLSAKFKRFAARAAIRCRLPIWYRDQICFALPRAPEIETALGELFPGQAIRLALSSGAPEGARNRKASALVLGEDGKLLAFAKLARSSIAREILENEARVLPRLAQIGAPRLILHREIDGTAVLAQSPLAGSPAPLALGEPHRKFLRSLQTSQRCTAAGTAMVSGLGQRLRHLPELADALNRVLPILRSFDVPVTIVHGDFAPWNLRIHDGAVSAFDWEYAELQGLPLVDEIHYQLQVGMMLENWSISQASAFLSAWAVGRPLGLQAAQANAIAIVYLLDALARLEGEGYDDRHEMIIWHRGILDRLLPPVASRAGKVAAA